MDILIKGMEMPKSCEDCELAKHFDGYNENDCPFNAFSFYDCPLISVPPHGRLIDAEEFYNAISMDDRTTIPEEIHIRSLLSEAPTIILASKEET